MNTKVKPNRLINEKSPYLIRHANNLVNWYPWGEEAFAKAKNENKPIFLSIGYASCHWCHVMEEESFMDEEVACLLNGNFVPIKVDREERPDIDNIYMMVCQIMTNRGGWPLTLVLKPNGEPIFAGTYLPKKKNHMGAGLIELLDTINFSYKEDKNGVDSLASNVMVRLNAVHEFVKKEDVSLDYIHDCYKNLIKIYDPEYGGFTKDMKFPNPCNLMFLLRYYKTFGEEDALTMVEKSLENMYQGGIYDHVGKGFSRYATDRKWLVPHFEKMLYDNALLIIVFTETYLVTKNDFYKKVAEEIIQYIDNEMTDKDGCFYSAQDAETEGEEGKYYIWTIEQIEDVLGKEDAAKYIKFYKISEHGNFFGKNVINIVDSCEEPTEELELLNNKLYEARLKRVQPLKDDKILTSWNGLMVAALAYAGRAYDEPTYISRAKKAVDFIYENLFDADGNLCSRYREGERSKQGFIDDYAFLTWGLIELYEATFNEEYIEKARSLNEKINANFKDMENGGYYMYSNQGEQLIVRPKEIFDGAMPSGNSVALYNNLRLSGILQDQSLKSDVFNAIQCFGIKLKNIPAAYCFFNSSILYLMSGNKEIIIAGDKEDNLTQQMINLANERFVPFSTLVLSSDSSKLVERKEKINGTATVYICQGTTCFKPTSDLAGYIDRLDV